MTTVTQHPGSLIKDSTFTSSKIKASDAANIRTSLGLGSAATLTAGNYVALVNAGPAAISVSAEL